MGYPKHLITRPDKTAWIERTAAVLAPFCQGLVISGQGDLPAAMPAHVRLPDPPGLAGPLAGIVAALRYHPRAAWLLAACDQPDISSQAVTWLLQQRAPAVRAILPDLTGRGKVEPLLALYEPRCQIALEAMALRGEFRISRVARTRGVVHPRPPADLAPAWRNVNRPSELRRGDAGPGRPGR
jgi:molybdopterin-guanine dinucleotide biosynthesis protein A